MYLYISNDVENKKLSDMSKDYRNNLDSSLLIAETPKTPFESIDIDIQDFQVNTMPLPPATH